VTPNHPMSEGPIATLAAVTGPKDAIRGLLGLRSVTERLDRVETAVRELALTKDEHQIALDLLASNDARLAELERSVHTMRDEELLRRFFAQSTAFDPVSVSVVVQSTGDDDAVAGTVDAVVHLLGAIHAPTVVDDLSELTSLVTADRPYVTILRAGDRLAHGWLPVAIGQLERHPEAAGVYGERIDLVAPDRNAVVSRFEPSFSITNLLQSACIDLGSLVIRRSMLVDATPGIGPLAGWDLVLGVAHQGHLRPVPVTASVGPIGPASTADDLARFREHWPAPNGILDPGPMP
jgi:hypothetical protein